MRGSSASSPFNLKCIRPTFDQQRHYTATAAAVQCAGKQRVSNRSHPFSHVHSTTRANIIQRYILIDDDMLVEVFNSLIILHAVL